MTWPITSTIVKEWTKVDSPADAASLELAVSAVVAYVPTIPTLKGYWNDDDPPAFDPPADVILGAAMLAARWHARRGSTLGTVGYPEFGSGLIMRHDPDIGRLLRLGNLSGVFAFSAPTLPVDEDA